VDPGTLEYYSQKESATAPAGFTIRLGKSNNDWLKLGSLRVCLECGFVAFFAAEEELSRLRKLSS
jgi:hypothetical protein